MARKPTYEELEKRVKELEKEAVRRKQVEESLREKEEYFRNIYEESPIGIELYDPDGKLLSVNKACLDIFGVTDQKKIEGFALFEDPNVTDEVKERLRKGNLARYEAPFDFGKVKELNLYETSKSGISHLDVVIAPLGTKVKDFPAGYLVQVQDNSERKRAEDGLQKAHDELGQRVKERTSELTKANDELNLEIKERKRIEESLRESEEKYRNLVERANDGVIILQDGIVKYVNIRLAKMFGYDVDEMIDTPFIDYVLPDERSKIMDIYIRRLQDEDAPDIYEMIALHKDGGRIDIETNSGIITYQGKPATLSFIRDITQRKNAEKELLFKEDIIRSSSSVISTCDLEGNMTFGNPAFLTKWGFDDAKEFLGKPFPEYWVVEDRLDEIMQALLKGEGRWFGETKARRKDGTLFDAQVSAATVYDTEGNPIALTSTSTDITESKRLEAQLLQAKKMEAIATLAGGIAHQFNNTLSPITVNLDLLQMDFPDENITGYIEPMRNSAHLMVYLTSQLLAYARGGKYQAKTFSLSDFVRDTIPLIEHTLKPSVHVETDLPRDIMSVRADHTQMQMVLSAIMSNSSEAIEDEGRIRITCRDETITESKAKDQPGFKPGHYVKLEIEDEGKGMDEETRSRIFEPFFTTKFQGRGLGMAAAYGIVKNHDGWIFVDSELGKGTKVCIYLPAIEAQLKEPKKPKIEPLKGTGTILIIEDEEMVMDVSRAVLERLGYHVLEARTGREAISIARTFDGNIDLAILDIVLPDMRGKGIYPLLIKALPNLKVIVCSGYSIEGPAQDILDAGAQGFMQKPFSVTTISEKLREVLEVK